MGIDVDQQASLEQTVALIKAKLASRGVKRLALLSWWRAKAWGLVLSIFTQGITTFKDVASSGIPMFRKVKLPEGPLVVVANHASHIDAVSLVTVIGRTRPVLVVAAADYWLTDKASEIIARTAIGIWPIRRGSEQAYDDLLEAKDLVLAGVVLVVFAEGGRSEDGSVGDFHSGAFRLAKEIDATVLPVSIIGSQEVLPRHATTAKHRPINLRLAKSLKVKDVSLNTKQVEQEIRSLHNQPVIAQPGFGFSRVKKIAFSWIGLVIVFFWAVGEGIFWPLVAEMPLLLLIVTVGFRFRGAMLIVASALGSIIGVLITWWLVDKGFNPPSPLTTEHMFDYARNQLAQSPNTAFWDQMWNGIPVKVYAHEAGALHLSFNAVLQSLFPRVLRIVILGTGGWLLGTTLARWFRANLGLVQTVGLLLFPLGLAQAIWFWSIYKGY
ncbi:MAG: hypothetical protein RIQ88_626 [Actinomycetota bacterium]|jgi:1-acyl-sn-glycerol-3-phosphate acyltransferase